MEIDPYLLAYKVLNNNLPKFGIPPDNISPLETKKGDSLDSIIPGFSTAVLLFQVASRKEWKAFLDNECLTAPSERDAYKRLINIMNKALPKDKIIVDPPSKAMKDWLKECQSKGISGLEARVPKDLRQELLDDALKKDFTDVWKIDLLAEAEKEDLLKDALKEELHSDSEEKDLLQDALKENLYLEAEEKDLLQDALKENLHLEADEKDLLQDALKENLHLEAEEKDLLQDALKENLHLDAEEKDLLQDAPKKNLHLDVEKKDLLQDALKENLHLDVEEKDLLQDALKENLHLEVEKKDLLQDAPKENLHLEAEEKDLLQDAHNKGLPGNFIHTKVDLPNFMAFTLAVCTELVLYERENENYKQYVKSMPIVFKNFFHKNVKRFCNKVHYTQDHLKDYSNSIKCPEKFLNSFISENKYEYDFIANKFLDYAKKFSEEKSLEHSKLRAEFEYLPKEMYFRYTQKKFEVLKEICKCVKEETANGGMALMTVCSPLSSSSKPTSS